MKNLVSKSVFILLCCLVSAFYADAQTPDASSADGKTGVLSKQDLPDGIKESLAKKRIQSEEKEYQQLIEKGEEAAKLSEEISSSIDNTGKLSSVDLQKLDRLEKLVKKIRTELGAKSDDPDDEETNFDKDNDTKNIKEITADLLSEIKKIGRYTISVVAIQSSNSLLKLVRFLKFSKN